MMAATDDPVEQRVLGVAGIDMDWIDVAGDGGEGEDVVPGRGAAQARAPPDRQRVAGDVFPRVRGMVHGGLAGGCRRRARIEQHGVVSAIKVAFDVDQILRRPARTIIGVPFTKLASLALLAAPGHFVVES